MVPPASVLDRYAPVLTGLRWQRAPGGFSGADVWRGDDESGSPLFALKAWPADYPADRLTRVQAWMAQAAHLTFVPTILPTADRQTFVLHDNRAWDVVQWMPGAPTETPSEPEVEAVCAAVARLHAVWPSTGHVPCPGVANRLRLLRGWLAAPLAPESFRGIAPQLGRLLQRAAALVTQAAPGVIADLQRWEGVSLRVQPCVRDLRGDHVLLTARKVTGIVDFGAMAEDHPAVDLARLLSDYAVGNTALVAAGLLAYRAAGGQLDASDEFISVLIRGGALGSAIIWLLRANLNRPSSFDGASVEVRLSQIIRQIEPFAAL